MHSIGHDTADMLSMRNAAVMNDDDRYVSAVIERASKMEKSSSLPFSEESPINVDMLKKYGMRDFGDSMSGSAVSSLANFDYPASPPQATTPTGEIRELLEQIRQLQENADSGKFDLYYVIFIKKSQLFNDSGDFYSMFAHFIHISQNKKKPEAFWKTMRGVRIKVGQLQPFRMNHRRLAMPKNTMATSHPHRMERIKCQRCDVR